MAIDRSDVEEILKVYLGETELIDRQVAAAALMQKLAEKGSNPPVYEVVYFQSQWRIFWRDHKDIQQGDHEVLFWWGDFGESGNRAKHTCDILNGKFPNI
jgi:hypothetical protein